MKRTRVAAALFVVACAVRPAAAANCTISSTNISFGTFSGTSIDITGTLTVKCPTGLAYNVGIDAGSGVGATVTNRLMTATGGAEMGYQLFQNSSHTVNWGNTPGVDTVSGTGTNANQTLSVYAHLPANEYAPAGNYTDATVTVSVTSTNPTVTSHFNVKATVLKACNIAASSLSFGAYTKTLINATSTISIQCTNLTTYNLGLDAGTSSGATVTNRSMTGPSAALLSYKLFRDSGRTLNWGNTVGTDTVAGTGTGAVQSLTVYGQLPAAQNVRPGSYTDTVTATLTF
jgi:spore coat protein U-like protein